MEHQTLSRRFVCPIGPATQREFMLDWRIFNCYSDLKTFANFQPRISNILITRTIFSLQRSEQFWKQNTFFCHFIGEIRVVLIIVGVVKWQLNFIFQIWHVGGTLLFSFPRTFIGKNQHAIVKSFTTPLISKEFKLKLRT